MEMETKFLRLRTPVELGSRFGDWSVCCGQWIRRSEHRTLRVVFPHLYLSTDWQC
jgi:hypothetical protein